MMCWSCKTTEMIVIESGKHEYYMCPTCNPDRKIEECIDGCYYACSNCRHVVPIGIDKEYSCSVCEKIICNSCIVWNDDEDNDTGEDEGAVFCSSECLQMYQDAAEEDCS